ncbi:MAG TPA: glucokinase [Spirochaetales bacterium]|nr:glucokinase [Spirochaetales bacterium]HRY53420.1 glucokinase [Spirochaetia bacterium]HRZ63562.1 glucokinase [Spirochaetia bacterium]
MISSRTAYDLVVLAGDVGGTNTNLALIGKKGGTFTLLFDRHYKTKEEPSLLEPLGRFLEEAKRAKPGLEPELCCVSGAGPVVDQRIQLTNAPWGIDARQIEAAFSIPSRLVNDFTAVSYGVLLLDPANPAQITRLPHLDGSLPEPQGGGVKAIVGAGTGLGVGYVLRVRDRIEAFPSEGGHITLPAYDDETRDFQRWLGARYGFVPGAEAGVSGQGIAQLFAFLAERAEASGEKLGRGAAAVLDASEPERPALVAARSAQDPLCARAMELFVSLYARVAADLTSTFLPSGGVYLAGGIAAKNEALFLGGSRFMASYERSYLPHIRSILARTPVMIVKDYSISLYGAANAAAQLL